MSSFLCLILSSFQGLDTALIRVDSPDELCMVVSIQNITCPVADLEDRTAGSGAEGIRQTVDKRSGLTVRRDLFPAGLHIAFIVRPDDVDCQQKTVVRQAGRCCVSTPVVRYGTVRYLLSKFLPICLNPELYIPIQFRVQNTGTVPC